MTFLKMIPVRSTTSLQLSIPGRKNLNWLAAMAFCVIALTTINGYRAAVQSLTHDEAVTYGRYVRGPLYELVSSTDANNHILFSLLSRATVGICGPSEFVLRLPSLLGGVLLIVMVGRVGMRVWGASLTTVLAIILVGLNPLVMDYLSVARGYSLAMAFWLVALDRLLAAHDLRNPLAAAGHETTNGTEPNSLDESGTRQIRRASQFLALSVLANLTFILAAVALAGCWAWLAWGARRQQISETNRQRFYWFWQTLVRPGSIIFACLSLPLVKLRPSHFYFGADSLTESLLSFVYTSFAHHRQSWPWDNSSPWFLHSLEFIALRVVPALLLILFILWLVVLRRFNRDTADLRSRVEPGEMLFYLSAGTLSVVIGFILALHWSIGLKLPFERTGLYLIVPLILAILSIGSSCSLSIRLPTSRLTSLPTASVTHGVLLAGAIALCVFWLAELQTTHYRPWTIEVDSRTVFLQIISQHEREPRQQLRVGATWFLVPALNFYRDVYKADYLEPIERLNHYPPDVDVYVVARPDAGGIPPDEPVNEIYRGSSSGTIVAIPIRKRLAKPSDMVARVK